MAFEDVIFGKNRHLYGGIEPSNMEMFGAYFVSGTTNIKVKALLPKDTVIEGKNICTIAGAVIRRKLGSYPVDEFDGELVADIKATNTNLLETTISSADPWHYQAFPYSAQGVYNRNKKNRAVITTEYMYLYGYDLNMLDANPTSRVIYPENVDNFGFTPGVLSALYNTFDPGSWDITPGHHFMPKPCVLKQNNTVYEFLNSSNYLINTNGEASKIKELSFLANAMMQWPKIYVKRWQEGNVYKFRCSDTKVDSDYECWSNYDRFDNEIPYFYTSIYEGYVFNNVIRSISGQAPTGAKTMDYFYVGAKANGEDWTMGVLSDYMLIRDLLVLLSKSTNGRESYGLGRSGISGLLTTGAYNTSGIFAGHTTENSAAVKVFGMENLWGNSREPILGWTVDMGYHKIKMTRGVKDGTTIGDYNLSGEGYIKLEKTKSIATGYIKETLATPYGRFPITSDGSRTTYDCDKFELNSQKANIIAWVGGDTAQETKNVGPFNVSFLYNSAEGQGTYWCARLACKPTKY